MTSSAKEKTGHALLADCILKAHHTAVSVQDFDAALDFFTAIIGMKVEGEMDRRREANLGPVTGVAKMSPTLVRSGIIALRMSTSPDSQCLPTMVTFRSRSLSGCAGRNASYPLP